MLLAILSDIYGNLPALEAVLADIAHFRVDGFIFAGDYVGCPQADETLDLIRSLHPWIIRGNSDLNLIRYAEGKAPRAWGTHKQFALNRWVHRNIRPESLAYLENLPDQCAVEISGAAPVRLVHGSPRDPYEEIFIDGDLHVLDLALGQVAERTLVCGHTHLPWKLERGGKLALNPGAVSGSLNGDPHAQYALLRQQGERWEVQHRLVPYDLVKLRRVFTESGLLEEGGTLARAFLLSNETGQNVAKFFLKYAYRLAEEAGYEDCQVIPDEIWERAEGKFPWSDFTK